MFTSLALKVHGETFRQHRHSNFAHCIRSLASEESRIDGRADNNDATLPVVDREMRKSGLDNSIEAFWIDLLHQSEPLHWSLVYRTPPNTANVVDDDIEAAI